MSENPLEKANATKLLLFLSDGGKTYTELLMNAQITPATLSRRLKEFQKTGLVRKTKKKDSKRGEVIYTLTVKGKTLIPAVQELVKMLKELEPPQ